MQHNINLEHAQFKCKFHTNNFETRQSIDLHSTEMRVTRPMVFSGLANAPQL